MLQGLLSSVLSHRSGVRKLLPLSWSSDNDSPTKSDSGVCSSQGSEDLPSPSSAGLHAELLFFKVPDLKVDGE